MSMKCIAHLDLDCFYAQVEALRLGIDCGTTPYGLSQWGGLIAVSYPARDCGVRRMDTVRDALQKCPNMQVSHVATYKIGESEYKYHPNPERDKYKISLEPYRLASKLIFDYLLKIPDCVVEKGGIDEVFIDVTAAARRWLAESVEAKDAGLESMTEEELLYFASRTSRVVAPKEDRDVILRKVLEETSAAAAAPSASETPGSTGGAAAAAAASRVHQLNRQLRPPVERENLVLLVAACEVVSKIRSSVRNDLGYYFSAGISHNRMLAKVLSAKHKPNQQTLLPPSRVFDFLVDFPFQKMRGLGGKFGEFVSAACDRAVTCGELWCFSLADLEERLLAASSGHSGAAGSAAAAARDEAESVYRQVRGGAADELVERTVAKMISANKAFLPFTTDKNVVKMWLTVLAGEIVSRTEEFEAINHVRAKTLRVWVGSGGCMGSGDVMNRSGPVPQPLTARAVVEQGMRWLAAVPAPPSGGGDMPRVNFVGAAIMGFHKVSAAEAKRPRQQQLSLDQMMLQFKSKKKEPDMSSLDGVRKQVSMGSSTSPVLLSSDSDDEVFDHDDEVAVLDCVDACDSDDDVAVAADAASMTRSGSAAPPATACRALSAATPVVGCTLTSSKSAIAHPKTSRMGDHEVTVVDDDDDDIDSIIEISQ